MEERRGFEWALGSLKLGGRVARDGWNGKGMWVEIKEADEDSEMDWPYAFIVDPHGCKHPWVPSQGDLFADDWHEGS